MTDTTTTLTRYMVPSGHGVEDHPAGLLYNKDEADAVIAALRAQLATAEAQAQTARDALEDITGVGFDMPATLELSDAEWSRRRASIMQQIARAALIQPTTTP